MSSLLPQISCIIVDGDAANLKELHRFMVEHGVDVVGEFSGVEPLPQRLAGDDPPQLVVVNLDPAPRDTLAKVAQCVRQFPKTSFFAMSEVVDAQVLMDAMHVGIKEYIPLPVDEEKFRQGLERIAIANDDSRRRARIIQIIPTAGGCGSTTVACNVAASLAGTGKTVLIDLDLLRGAVAASFDIRARYSIADLMDVSAKVDRVLLDNALTVHQPTGLAILARPEMPEDAQRVNAAGLRRLLDVLCRLFDYVVIDSLMSLDPIHQAVTRAADLNVLVMQLNVPAARNTARFMGAIRRLGVAQDRIRVVVNRFAKRGCEVEVSDVERTLGLHVFWTIPNDFKNTLGAINYGQPVVLRSPRAEVSDSLVRLAGLLNGRAAHEESLVPLD